MHLLGGVDEQEEERERARRGGAHLERKPAHALEKGIQRWRVGIATPAGATRAPQTFDNLKRVVPLELPNHAAKGAGEPADVLVQRHVLWTRRRLPRHGSAHTTSRMEPRC
jgi:hypothetical protein